MICRADIDWIADRRLNKHVGRNVGGAGIQAVGEFLVDLRLGQRPRCVTGGALHRLAGDRAAVGEFHRHLILRCGAGQFGIVFGGGDDFDLAHQRLYVGTLDEFVGQLAQADALGDDAARHGELHAELRGEAGLRLVVAQDRGEIVADVDGDFLHVIWP